MSSANHARTGRVLRHRLEKNALTPQAKRHKPHQENITADSCVDCGWGRLFFAQTFSQNGTLIPQLVAEETGKRDIAFYVQDPHVMLSGAPQDLFLDPSHTYRLYMHDYRPVRQRPRGFTVRRVAHMSDGEQINRIYAVRNMVTVPPEFFWRHRDSRLLTYLVAEDSSSGDIIGTVTGISHYRAFNDPEHGCSLWCLAVDPQAQHPKIGETLVRQLIEHFAARGAAYLDLSVMHDNDQAIALYEKLGFQRVAYFAVKNKNSINEKLFSGPSFDDELNPYAMIILDEARRRGLSVEILDAKAGYFQLSFGGRSIICRESLSELTTAIAMSRCADKAVTRRILGSANLMVPAQMAASSEAANTAFLKQYGRVVVKPVEGEQGRGISVDIRTVKDLQTAIKEAARFAPTVLIEEFIEGDDLRVIVIDFKVVAAAVRRPPVIIGDGVTNVRKLIELQSRRRAAATGGESSIPLDAETKRCLAAEKLTLTDVPEKGRQITVRKTANLHTGGTIHDVTETLHPRLVDASIKAAKALDIPVVGLDLIVESPRRPDYVIIEANERPGLANHEPQPTAERFIDLLFPQTVGRPQRLLEQGQLEQERA